MSCAPQTYRKLKKLQLLSSFTVLPRGTGRPECMSMETGKVYLSCVMTDCDVFAPCSHAISGNDRPRAKTVQLTIHAMKMYICE